MTFRQYVRGLRLDGNTERATFITDVRSDKAMPDVKEWNELEAYLRANEAGQESLDQARSMWLNYQWASGVRRSCPLREHRADKSLINLQRLGFCDP